MQVLGTELRTLYVCQELYCLTHLFHPMGPFINIINKELVYTIQVKRTKNRKRIHTEGAGGRMRGQAKGCIHNQVAVYKFTCIISTVSESSVPCCHYESTDSGPCQLWDTQQRHDQDMITKNICGEGAPGKLEDQGEWVNRKGVGHKTVG